MKTFFLVYDQQGAYGSGGYSRNAKHKPLPRAVCVEGKVTEKGKSIILPDGTRKLKATVFDDSTPPRLIRVDYDLDDLRKIGAELPATYISTNGSIKRGSDGHTIFAAK